MPVNDSLFGLPPAAPKWVRLPGDPPALRAELEQEQSTARDGGTSPGTRERGTMSGRDNPNCGWCKPRIPRKANSDWEQQVVSTGEWVRMCNRCANSRLKSSNPWMALVQMRMRKVGSGEPAAKTSAMAEEPGQ